MIQDVSSAFADIHITAYDTNRDGADSERQTRRKKFEYSEKEVVYNPVL